MDVLRGLNLPGGVVGFARGLLEAAVLAAVGGALIFLSELEVSGEAKLIVPLAVWGLRTVEGLADQIDPAKQRGSP